jgi:transcriptional regulator with XRE-family HTH domain
VAREAGIGKSQLSKYENGKELPKLDSLEKVLNVLDVGHFEFFYTLYLVDRRAADLGRGRKGKGPQPEGAENDLSLDDEPAYAPIFKGHPLLSEATDQAFTKVFSDLLVLYRRVFEQIVLSGMNGPGNVKAPN